LLERNVALIGDQRTERFGTPLIHLAYSKSSLSRVGSELGQFDEAVRHAESAVQIAEGADQPYSLTFGLSALGLAHLHRGDLPSATRVLERGLHLCRTWQIIVPKTLIAAALSAAYARAGSVDEALTLLAGAVEELRRRQFQGQPAFVSICAGTTYLLADRIEEATGHAREALALTRRLGARGSEAHALHLNGDVASTIGAEDAQDYYRQALALAAPRGMRPLVAHCNLGLGKLHRRNRNRGAAEEHLGTSTAMYREMDMTYWVEQAEAEMRQLG
jgi:tetratricopeptide (TPR) repeat protein